MNAPCIFVVCLLCSSNLAHAQSVWRCDDAGRVVYQGEPCRGGRAVEAAPERPSTAAAEAARIAAREQALARQLTAERRQRDAQPTARAAGIPHPKTELSPSKKPPLRKKHPRNQDEAAGTLPSTGPSTRQKPD
jgi:hypothetical protein